MRFAANERYLVLSFESASAQSRTDFNPFPEWREMFVVRGVKVGRDLSRSRIQMGIVRRSGNGLKSVLLCADALSKEGIE